MERDVISAFTHIDKSLNFNSHAHVERDIISDFINWNNGISTHTLTWSVTEMFSYFVNKFGISTHTLTWSVTR